MPEALHKLHLGVSRLLKNCPIQYLLSEDVYSQPNGPSERKKRLSSFKRPLFGACIEILVHAEDKYALPGLNASFAKREKSAQHNGLFTRDGLRGMSKGKNSYATHVVFSSTASFVDRSIGLEERCELTRMYIQ